MKLTQKQLRALVESLVAEAEGETAGMDGGLIDFGIEDVLDAIADAWHSSYNESDPSMGASGKEFWDQQVESAVDALRSAFEEAYARIDQKLTGGDFGGY